MDKHSNFIAHVRQNQQGDWQSHLLAEHLKKVAQLAKNFAGNRGGLFVEYAGLLHDLGKFQQAFQEYIRNQSGFERENAHVESVEDNKRISHSTAGAKYLVTLDKQKLEPFFAYLLAYLIAGHHAGLADWYDKGSLKRRLQNADAELSASLLGAKALSIAEFCPIDSARLASEFLAFFKQGVNSDELHIWIRYLFSCLVDADFLDTEAFMNGYDDAEQAKQAGLRPYFPELATLYEKYSEYMQVLAANAKDSVLNRERQAILAQCFQAADLERSLFSLTVPTGGGKTLASLGFALKHALKFNKKRIIYTIPFTSIIEQNAAVFRQIFGEDIVLEHHCNLDGEEGKETVKLRLAAENWDAPLIVTTNVQFFESLFSARTSRCRKIHHIADSVVILDEAQQLPREFQKPITDMMRVLAKDYGVTFVLCTATQPELGKVQDQFERTLLEGLPEAYEIIEDKIELAQKLRRVSVQLPEKNGAKQSWSVIAAEIAQRDCVLAIVNTRKHAQTLFEALPTNGIKLHLSANMCAAHRSETIALIRYYLTLYRQGKLAQPLWVVSTQLIEAGVDLDFPVVFRAMAGLDSIAQSAGRCNREGKLPEGQLGEMIVFRAEQGAPAGHLKQGQDITEEMLSADLLLDPLSPESFSLYFQRFNAKGERDKFKISTLLQLESNQENPLAIQFRTAAEKFRLINNNGVALIVPFIPLVYQNKNRQPQIIPTNELNDFFKAHLTQENAINWQDVLKLYRYPTEDKYFGSTDKPALPEPFEMWFTYLESDPLKHKWVYRKLQRYTISVSESQLKTLPKEAILSRAGLLVLDVGYYNEVLGGSFDDTVLSPINSVL